MTEIQKAKETLEWLDFLDLIRHKVDAYASTSREFNNGLKNEIIRIKKECEDIIGSKDKTDAIKETLSNLLLAYSKQRKEFNIPIKPQSIIDAENLLKQLK